MVGHQHDRGSPAGAGPRPGRAWSGPPPASSRGPGQHVEQALRVRGGEDAGRQRPVGGEPGQRDVGAQRLRGGVAAARRCARPRCPRRRGPPARSARRRPSRSALSRAADSSGASIRDGSATPAARSTSADWATSATRWLAALASPAWYSARFASSMTTGSPPISMTRASAAGSTGSGAVTPKLIPVQPVQVVRPPGERHHRVQRQRQRAVARVAGLQHGRAVPAAGVREQPAGQRRTGRGQPGHQAGQHVVGHGQQDQVGGGQHLGRRRDRHAGQHPRRGGPATSRTRRTPRPPGDRPGPARPPARRRPGRSRSRRPCSRAGRRLPASSRWVRHRARVLSQASAGWLPERQLAPAYPRWVAPATAGLAAGRPRPRH